MSSNPLHLVITVIALLLAAPRAFCQMDPAAEGPDPLAAENTVSAAAGEPDSTSADQSFLSNESKPEIEAPAEEKGTGLKEDPDQKIFSIGGRIRWLMIPEWLISAFNVDTARASRNKSPLPLISRPALGAEFTYRRKGFDITASVWHAWLGWGDPISFKEEGKNEDSWEVVDNNLKAWLITVDFIWSTSLTDWFAITYGAGLGAGIAWGEIVRTEARYGSGETEHYVDKCSRADIGREAGCGDPAANDDEQYGEAYDTPPVIPWINLLAGVRFKPHRHMAIYVDGGFGLGFVLGTRAGYIF